jgi:hypothetical protein
MNLRLIDSLDRPNAPAGPAPPMTASPAPAWLWLVAIVAVCAFGGALLWLLRPFVEAILVEFQAALGEYASFIRLVLVAGFVAVLALIIRRLWHWSERGGLVQLENGHPVHRADLRQLVTPEATQLALRHYDVLEANAANPTRNATTYGPSTNSSWSYRYDGNEAPPVVEAEPLPLALPSHGLKELVAAGDVGGTGRTLFVGHSLTDGAPLKIDMDGTGFIGLGGKSGQGKSNTGLLLLTQAAYQGWAVFACDLHYHKRESMLRRAEPVSGLLARQATTAAEIADAIRTVDRIGRNRLEGRVPADTTVLLIIDEFTHLVISQQLPKEILDLLPAMAIAYRGVRVHGLLIGHDYGAKSLGQNFGRVLRGALTTAIAHRMTPDAAEFLLPAGYAKAAEGLSTGRALVFNDSTEEPIRTQIPFLRADDVSWAARGTPPKPYAPRQIAAAPVVTPPPSYAAPAPQRNVEPTEKLKELTIPEQVVLFLQSNPRMEFDSLTIARRLGIDAPLVQTALTKLVADRQVRRGGKPRNYLYSI